MAQALGMEDSGLAPGGRDLLGVPVLDPGIMAVLDQQQLGVAVVCKCGTKVEFLPTHAELAGVVLTASLQHAVAGIEVMDQLIDRDIWAARCGQEHQPGGVQSVANTCRSKTESGCRMTHPGYGL